MRLTLLCLALAACDPAVPSLTGPARDDQARGDGGASDGLSFGSEAMDASAASARDARPWSLNAREDGSSAGEDLPPRGGAGGHATPPDGNGGRGGTPPPTSSKPGGMAGAQGGLGVAGSGGLARHDARAGSGGGVAGNAGGAGGSGGHSGSGGTAGAGSISRAPRAGDLLIDEIMIDPAGADLGKEWVEVYNASSESLDLSQVVLADDLGRHALAPLPGVDPRPLGPGVWAVLGQSGDLTKNGGVTVDWIYGTQLGLNNGGDRVALCWIQCDAGLLAEIRWASQDPALVGHALVIEPGGRRCPASSSYGLAGDDSEAGTPGRRNDPCP